jgi:hypothetical protein
VEEIDGWEMTAVAARLLEAEGAYRSPSENAFLFLLYDQLEKIPESEIADYMPLKIEEQTQSQTNRQTQRSWLSRLMLRIRRSSHERGSS